MPSIAKAMIAVSVLLTSPVLAGGIYLSEIGSPSSLGTASAGNVTNFEGADSSWTNPAGMTGIDGTMSFSGIQVLLPKVEFDPSIAQAGGDDGGNAGDIAAIPSFFFVKPLNDRWRFGLSTVAPFGGGVDYGDNFAGRYAIEELTLQGLAVSPSLGYKVNDQFSLGFGVSIVYTLFEMDLAINQSAVGAPDAKVKLEELDDIGLQPFVGLQWRYSDRGVFGAVYRAEMDVDLEGDLKVTNLALPLMPQSSFEFSWDNAQLLEIGIRHQLSDDWFVVASADWEDWSAFSDNILTINNAPMGPLVVAIDRNWKDTYKFAFGLVREMDNNSRLAFGISYDTSPVDDEDRTLDLPIDEQVRLSVAWGRKPVGPSNWVVGATLLWLGDGEVDQIAGGQRIAGDFDKNFILFVGATYLKRFGQ